MSYLNNTDNTPCWYDLFYDPKRQLIGLRIHQEIIGKVIKGIRKEKILSIVERFKFNEFEESFDRFGFYSIFQIENSLFEKIKNFVMGRWKNDFIKLTAKLPKKEKSVCCSKKECILCNGDGFIYKYNAKKILAIIGSLSLLLHRLNSIEKKVSCKKVQLLTVKLARRLITGTYSSSLRKILINLSSKEKSFFQGPIRAMRSSFEYMVEEKAYNPEYYFEISENGWLSIGCPGDACGLFPSEFKTNTLEGYNFSPHNIDTPMQVLILLCGLAELTKKIRQKGSK